MFDIKKPSLTKDEIAELLRTTPEALAVFEKEYAKSALEYNKTSHNLFDFTKKDIVEKKAGTRDMEDLQRLIERITDELVASTPGQKLLETDKEYVTKEEINAFPEEIRPQLSASLYKVDCDPESSSAVLYMYKKFLETGNRMFYYQFRQGLDILDLDPILYAILGMNPNSMGYWFPALKQAVDGQDFFKVPETKIIEVPMPILQLTRIGLENLTSATKQIVNGYCMKVFDLDVTKTYFVKTGTYSSKFNFRNAKVEGEQEVRELGEYLLYLSSQAVEMASPLSSPSIYGVSTCREWCVREYIEDTENNPAIYNGMPLHTEYRVFCDFDTDEILGISPYWRSDVMLERFGGKQSNPYSPHNKHDYIIYKMHEPVLYKRYEENKDKVTEHLLEMLLGIPLHGQWSVDVMQNGNDFYIIDMATAETSALKDCVPEGKLVKQEEKWLPVIEGKK